MIDEDLKDASSFMCFTSELSLAQGQLGTDSSSMILAGGTPDDR